MGYEVKRYPAKKNGERTWFVKWVREGATREERFVPRSEWPSIGLNPSMTFEQARSITKSLNLKAEDRRLEERRNGIARRLGNEAKAEVLYLPSALIVEFEQELADKKNSKLMLSHWRKAKRLILEWRTPPKEWARRADALYLKMRGISPSYSEKIIRVLNDYLQFISDKTDKFHRLIPYPSGDKKQDLVDAFESRGKTSKESRPLTLDHLSMIKQKASVEQHYNYMHATLWLGLRPVEADKWGVKPRATEVGGYRLEGNNVAVYQWKLRGIAYEQRWKLIPLLFEEQRVAVERLIAGECKAPLVKSIKGWIGDGYNRYAGRKGFEQLMRSLGRKFFEVQAWLGHMSIDRTWRDYKAKNRVVIE